MHLVVVSAVVATIFGDIDHAFHAAVQRCIEDASLSRCATFDSDAAQRRIPLRPRLILQAIQAPGWDFTLQIPSCLLHANERDTVTKVQRLCLRRHQR